MLSLYCTVELQDVLLQEKKFLKHVKEELVSTADIQVSFQILPLVPVVLYANQIICRFIIAEI